MTKSSGEKLYFVMRETPSPLGGYQYTVIDNFRHWDGAISLARHLNKKRSVLSQLKPYYFVTKRIGKRP